MENPKRKHRVKIAILVVSLSLVVAYVLGGTLAGFLVPKAIFASGSSTKADLDKVSMKVYKQRADYDSMAHREIHEFESDRNKLKGYLYGKGFTKGTVLYAHGMNLQADAHESAIADFFLRNDYRVFMVDLTASGDSEGKDMGSLSQSVHDVKAAWKYMEQENLFVGKRILSGYSWGGHGVSKAFADGLEADKLVAFAPYDSAYEEMVAMASRRSGGVSNITIPTFALGMFLSQGEEAFQKASDHLKKKSDKCFFVQGKNDGTVFYSCSIAKAMYRSHATLYLTDDTHLTPWFSQDARDYYRNEIEPKLKDLQPEDEEAFLATVDREKTSQLDDELFARILTFLA